MSVFKLKVIIYNNMFYRESLIKSAWSTWGIKETLSFGKLELIINYWLSYITKQWHHCDYMTLESCTRHAYRTSYYSIMSLYITFSVRGVVLSFKFVITQTCLLSVPILPKNCSSANACLYYSDKIPIKGARMLPSSVAKCMTTN